MNTIFVTGATSGIGRATALRFADEGWHVLAAGRDFNKAPELISRPEIDVIRLDVTDLEAVAKVVDEVLLNNKVDVLFNNAGHLLMGPAEMYTEEDIRADLEINLLAPIRMARAFLPAFRAQRKGLIINTTSMTALVAGPFMSVYGASKAGLERWSFGMNHELNPFGIRVKTIVPGIVSTALAGRGTLADGGDYQKHLDMITTAFGRPKMADSASAPEVTAAVVYEAATDGSDRIRYLTDSVARDQISMMIGYGEERLQVLGTRAMFD